MPVEPGCGPEGVLFLIAGGFKMSWRSRSPWDGSGTCLFQKALEVHLSSPNELGISVVEYAGQQDEDVLVFTADLENSLKNGIG